MTPKQAERKQLIADHLVGIERQIPDSIRVRANPYLIRAALKTLSQIGFNKRFLAPPQQFVIESFLSSSLACNALLGDCALVGPRDDQSRYPAWSGAGEFRGWLGPLPDFQPGDRILFVINIAPIVFHPIGANMVL